MYEYIYELCLFLIIEIFLMQKKIYNDNNKYKTIELLGIATLVKKII